MGYGCAPCQDQGTEDPRGEAGARIDSAEPSRRVGGRLEGCSREGSREALGPRPAGYLAPLSQAQRCLSPAGAHRGTGEPGVNRQGRIWLRLPGTSQELGLRRGGQDRELVSDPSRGLVHEAGPGGGARGGA